MKQKQTPNRDVKLVWEKSPKVNDHTRSQYETRDNLQGVLKVYTEMEETDLGLMGSKSKFAIMGNCMRRMTNYAVSRY